MTTITVKTYTGKDFNINRKKANKVMKALALIGQKPMLENPSNEVVIRYLRSKQASLNTAIDKADIYSAKLEGRCLKVI